MKMYKYCPSDHNGHFQKYFQDKSPNYQVGHGIGDYSGLIPPYIGVQHQRGYGIGNVLGSVVRGVVKLIKPTLEVAKKEIKRRVLEGGKNVLKKGILGGKGLKRAMKEEAVSQGEELFKDSINYMANMANKKRKTTNSDTSKSKSKKVQGKNVKRKPIAKKRGVLDIFG